MNSVPQTVADRQTKRVLLVAAGSAVAFIGLAVIIYWLYFVISDSVYDRRLGEGLRTVQILFYAAFVLHMLGSFGVTVVLTKWTKVPIYPTFAAVAVVFVLLALPMLMILSFGNFCETNVSFPIPGQTNC